MLCTYLPAHARRQILDYQSILGAKRRPIARTVVSGTIMSGVNFLWLVFFFVSFDEVKVVFGNKEKKCSLYREATLNSLTKIIHENAGGGEEEGKQTIANG